MDDPTPLLQTLIAAVCSPSGSFEEAMAAAQRLLPALDAAEDLDELLSACVAGVDADDVERAGIAAIIAGTLVERGADANIVARALTARLPGIAAEAERYLDACRAQFQQNASEDAGCEVCGPGQDEQVMLPGVRQAVREWMPEGEAAWVALDLFCSPVVSVLTRLPELRRELAGDDELVFRCGILAQHQPAPYFVFAALSVLDGARAIVLDPAEKKGFELVLDGIADNRQLHLLLADALIGAGHVDGERPTAEIVAAMRGDGPRAVDDYVSGYWNLFHWTGLRADGTLPDGYFDTGADHWIWNEGIPADISSLDGTRLILLAPTPYVRAWQPARLFDALPAKLEVTAELDVADVEEWIEKIARANQALDAGA